MNSVDVSETGPVDGWLAIAIAKIDEVFGKDGYAEANPALVGAYVQACAIASLRTAMTDELVNALSALKRLE